RDQRGFDFARGERERRGKITGRHGAERGQARAQQFTQGGLAGPFDAGVVGGNDDRRLAGGVGIQRAQRRQSLGGGPQVDRSAIGRDRQPRRAAVGGKRVQPLRPACVARGLLVGQRTQAGQRLVHLVDAA